METFLPFEDEVVAILTKVLLKDLHPIIKEYAKQWIDHECMKRVLGWLAIGEKIVWHELWQIYREHISEQYSGLLATTIELNNFLECRKIAHIHSLTLSALCARISKLSLWSGSFRTIIVRTSSPSKGHIMKSLQQNMKDMTIEAFISCLYHQKIFIPTERGCVERYVFINLSHDGAHSIVLDYGQLWTPVSYMNECSNRKI